MNEFIIKEISNDLGITTKQVEATLKLLSEGNTIPFIARYRKEVTNNLDEEQIRKIDDVYEYQVNLLKRKEDVIRLIDEKGLLTLELKNSIMSCSKLVEVEDIYRPFKEKKKTKATDAIKNGLEPLAKIIMSQPNKLVGVDKFINENVKSCDDAIMGAKYIIAEWISDNASYRKYIRSFMYSTSMIDSKLKKNAVDENKVYSMYYEYSEPIKSIKPHRVLALNRGEKEGILNVKIVVDDNKIVEYLNKKLIKNTSSECVSYIEDAIKDSLSRLIMPSVEREVRSELTDNASEKAIEVFMDNLHNLLLTPPMKDKMVLGLDPAFRTGCKLAVIDYTGKFLEKSVIYPHEPKCEVEKSKKIVLDLINKYNIDIIAIGNGTASRESEAFITDVIKECNRKVQYIMVNEAGASVYSASKLAISEFPDLHVEERSAISIARRLQDPLSELVKVDSKSIGVGQYQHDVSEKKLDEGLDFVVTKAVNEVGVNINTASPSLLKYVSGLNKRVIDKIIEYRDSKGKFLSREEIKKKKILSDKVYEQAIGFLRITDGVNPLDKTSIHTESYDKTLELLKMLNLSIDDIGTDKIKNINIDISGYSKKLGIDEYTLTDIVNALKNPLRDPRDDMPRPILRNDVLKIEDLAVGMKLQGTVRNVVDFGAFIDIGLKNDGLVHISKMSKEYIKHPSEVVSVGDIVDCYVDEIHMDKNKVSLSLIK